MNVMIATSDLKGDSLYVKNVTKWTNLPLFTKLETMKNVKWLQDVC